MNQQHSTTQAQKFAAAYAAKVAEENLTTIAWLRRGVTAVALIGMLVSYSNQVAFLHHIGLKLLGAILIPISMDLLTLICVRVLGTPAMDRAGKRTAMYVLLFPVLTSAWINSIAETNLVAQVISVVPVLGIVAGELVRTRAKPDFRELDEIERGITPEIPASRQPLPDEVREERARKARATREANRRAGMSRGEKAWDTRRRNEVDAMVNAINEIEGTAPVSPAVNI